MHELNSAALSRLELCLQMRINIPHTSITRILPDQILKKRATVVRPCE